MLHLIDRAQQYGGRIAVYAEDHSYSYDQLLAASAQVASALLDGKPDLEGARIAFMIAPGFDYVAVQWAIWRAGGIAVPLCITHPLPALEYVIDDTAAAILVVGPEFEPMLAPLAAQKAIPLMRTGDGKGRETGALPDIDPSRPAMILYTSGTTSRPKGVVTTHANIEAQIKTLVKAWEWEPADHILCVLPLHHVHGIINVVNCALWTGARCTFQPKFDPEAVFDLFRKGTINLFMAVPTIYFKLIAYWESLPPEEQRTISAILRSFRLMVSGSAALPVSVLEKWRTISGHTLLERYGMTEIGMALSNSYRGERRPGFVGLPLPGVTIRLADEQGREVPPGEPGEIQVKGSNVFPEYWNRPEATRDAFRDGWFCTGDIAVFENGSFRILGRNSVDIIKSGGYKISALEIEEVLRTHPSVKDCAVVGLPDEEWGEIVAAGLVMHNLSLDTGQLRDWLRGQLPAYKVPRQFLTLDELPRNALGKVTKNEVKRLFE